MNSNQLRFIDVKGYKSIKDQKIEIKKINVLIGQNGAGKSNFISVFGFIRSIIYGRLGYTSIKIGAEKLLHYGNKKTKQIEIITGISSQAYKVILEPKSNDLLFIVSEESGFLQKKNNEYVWELISKSENESKLYQKIFIYNTIDNWRIYHFQDTTDTAGVKKYCSITDNKFLFEDASNLAAFLYVLKETENEYYLRILKTVQLVIPFFKDFVLSPNPLNIEIIRLEWQDKYSEKIFTANELSDGSLRFICLATLLLQKDLPKLILIDEPELGLHPTAITILAGLIKKASFRSQVIVSTQCVDLVNEFEPEDIIVVENKNSETIFKRLESKDLEYWLNEYSLGDLWDKNIIGGNP